ncbi:MAG: hypothetical protein ACI9XP_000672 [Lentimonas sp.]|jgi:hypothetical protein
MGKFDVKIGEMEMYTTMSAIENEIGSIMKM